jgi:uncharacterized protein YndB with AHSA1/START domain
MLPILLALVFVALLIFIVIAGQPDEFQVSRSVNISAPREKIFPLVNELHQWEAWNPWAKLDPHCKITYDGPPAGVGASYTWAGNAKVGAGQNTIVESRTNETVRFRLDFAKPMQTTNAAEFTFCADGGQTRVTWTMSGKTNFGGKIFGLFVNCNRMIGRDFEKGLATMKAVAETAA